MKRVSFLIVLIAIAALLTLAIAGNEFGPTFKNCIRQEAAQQSEKASPNDTHPVAIFLKAQTVCTLSLIDRHSAFFSFLATLIIAWFTGTLWIATREQGKFTLDALAANRRAFVFAKDIFAFWEPGIEGTFSWRFKAVLENSGDTPTRNLTLYIDSEFLDAPLPNGFNFANLRYAPGNGLMPPRAIKFSGQTPAGGRAPITAHDIIDIQNGRKFLYVWGFVKYRDVFENTAEHITRFCWLVIPVGNPMIFKPPEVPGGPINPRFDTIFHHEGNCADDDCYS